MGQAILVTGSGGFVGRSLCRVLTARNHAVTAAQRAASQPLQGHKLVAVGDIGPDTEWGPHLVGIDTVVHLAARAHVLVERAADPIAAFRRVNTAGTLSLARAARVAGVRRFVYVSSIGVHGSSAASPVDEASPCAPEEPYAVSKWEAEQALRAYAPAVGLELVIARPPLVYGPECSGNFRRLLDLVQRGLPLPLGSFDNRRSLIGIDNLTDMLALCAEHPNAAGQTYVVADEPAISTPELMRTLAQGMGRPHRLWRLPPRWVRGAARTLGHQATLDKLCGTLQVNPSHALRQLGWIQRVPLRDGLLAVGRWYAQQRVC